jgi:hypothetical protein
MKKKSENTIFFAGYRAVKGENGFSSGDLKWQAQI